MVDRDEIGLIAEPKKPNHLPKQVQWLAGQGCGSWFLLKPIDNSVNYMINRYSPKGELEFSSEFILKTQREFSYQCPYVFTYISHHKMCTIIQHNHKFEFYNTSFL